MENLLQLPSSVTNDVLMSTILAEIHKMSSLLKALAPTSSSVSSGLSLVTPFPIPFSELALSDIDESDEYQLDCDDLDFLMGSTFSVSLALSVSLSSLVPRIFSFPGELLFLILLGCMKC